MCASWSNWLLTRVVPLSSHQPMRMHQACTLPDPLCPSTLPSTPLYTTLAKYPFYHLNKILLGSYPPRTWMPSFWREPRQTAWHLHSSPMAKVVAKTEPWNKGHRKLRHSLRPGPSKRSAWADCIIKAIAVSLRQTVFQPWLFLVFQVATFNRNAPIKNAVHSITLQATQSFLWPPLFPWRHF